MITTGEYGLTLFKTQGGFYDPGNTIGNIDPSMAMDPIISQVAAYLPGGAEVITELESTTDEERIQEIYGIILTTMADQCLTTPLVYGQSRKGNQEKRSLSHGRIRAAFLLPIDIIRGISP